MKELGINHIQTAVKGRKAEVEMKIEKGGNENYKISCLNQQVTSAKTRKRNKAIFDITICLSYFLKESCKTQIQRQESQRVFYFTEEDFLKNKRRIAIRKLPIERRKIRPNIEATVNEFRQEMNHKGKFRGLENNLSHSLNI